MNCNKCNKEINPEDKFCNNCGTEIKKDSLSSLNETIDLCIKTWFMLGFLRACFTKNKKDRKILKDFEDSLKEKIPDMWDKYQGAIKFMKDIIDEKKETSGLKQKGISKAKAM